MDLLQADSRDLSDPMAEMLEEHGPRATFDWLIEILNQQRPALRSPNSKMVAYTGCPEALNWIEENVESPVTTHWGEGAALLGAPWVKIKEWLNSDKSTKIMALDTLYAYRLPTPNMALFTQIAAPVLEDAPTLDEFEATLNAVLEGGANPRMRQMIEAIIGRSLEILTPRERGVPVEDLSKLFIDPEAFKNSNEVLTRHEKVRSGIKESINNIINGASK